jgi:hypothetical protein
MDKTQLSNNVATGQGQAPSPPHSLPPARRAARSPARSPARIRARSPARSRGAAPSPARRPHASQEAA